MKYDLCVKLCQHNFTIVIVHKLLIHGNCFESGLHAFHPEPLDVHDLPNLIALLSDTSPMINKGKIQHLLNLKKRKNTLSKNYLISDIMGQRAIGYSTLSNGRTMEMNTTLGNQRQVCLETLSRHLKKDNGLKNNYLNLNRGQTKII